MGNSAVNLRQNRGLSDLERQRRSIAAGAEIVELPAGHLDEVRISDHEVRIAGWILWPEEPIVGVQVWLETVFCWVRRPLNSVRT